MKIIKNTLFAVSIILLLSLLFGIKIPLIPNGLVFPLIMIMGFLSAILNLISAKKSKHAVLYTVFYWSSFLLIILGILFTTMHWPMSRVLLYTGMGTMLISLFLPKRRKQSSKQANEDVLDDL